MSLLLIYNPVCGDSTAEQFFTTHVIPRISSANRVPTEIFRTPPPDSAGIEVPSLLSKYKGETTIVLGSGDGTLHEIVNHLAFATDEAPMRDDSQSLPIHFVLIPCGTANALYASLFRPAPHQETIVYKLRSLEAFIQASTPRLLTLSLTSLVGPHGQDNPRHVASVVVTSTALHAAILKDSEKLRSEIPGIERFKVAARQNITKWYASRVKLLPAPSSGVVYIYDPQKGDFVPTGDADQSPLDIHGPFAYFLSTVNVDRLEPEFRINPTISKNPPLDTSLDIVMIRPQRDPTITLDTFQARGKFVEKLVAVLTAAYQDGNHLNLRYSEKGDIVESGNGDTVVECYRCGGWEWIPDEEDEDAHSVCVDGTIFEIEQGGRATCRVVPPADTNLRNFHVYV